MRAKCKAVLLGGSGSAVATGLISPHAPERTGIYRLASVGSPVAVTANALGTEVDLSGGEGSARQRCPSRLHAWMEFDPPVPSRFHAYTRLLIDRVPNRCAEMDRSHTRQDSRAFTELSWAW